MFSESDIIILPLVMVGKIIILCSAGVYLVQKKIIDNARMKQISKMVQNFFLPCLVFSQFVRVDVPTFFSSLPFIFMITLGIYQGVKVGEWTSRYYLKDGHYHYMLMNANGFAHSVNVQIMVVQTVSILLDEIDRENKIESRVTGETRGLIYVMISQVVNNILRWSIGNKLVIEEFKYDKVLEQQETELKELIEKDPLDNLQNSKPKYPPPGKMPDNSVKAENNQSWLEAVKEVMNIPLIVIMIAVVICVVPFLQYIFTYEESFIHLTITKASDASAKVVSPVMMVLLGSNIAMSDFKNSPVNPKITWSMTISKCILMPLTAIPVVYVLIKIGFLEDPVMLLVLLITYAAPTANNTLLFYAPYDTKMKCLSTTMFYQYLIFALTLPLIMIIFFRIYL